jgi:hypothetical protein
VGASKERRYIFTVCTGRCGQSSFANLLEASVPDCRVAFEAPHFETYFEGRAGSWERRIRRRFFETHELLGRGRVLPAFDQGNDEYLKRIVKKRLSLIERDMTASDTSTYFDVSKYFARGLHIGFGHYLQSYSLVLLVRDPVLNMRSFLNRDKDFYLDNTRPDAPRNILKMEASSLSKGELYLWSWCEMYLRYLDLAARDSVKSSVIVKTSNLQDADYLAGVLEQLALPHNEIVTSAPTNTNLDRGIKATRASEEDLSIFYGFLDKLPEDVLQKISYFDDYVPGLTA